MMPSHAGPAQPPSNCARCPLRSLPLFSALSERTLSIAQRAKSSILNVPARAKIYLEDEPATKAYTLFDGWAFRYKLTPDGQRQILDFVLPGDLMGMQVKSDGSWNHSAETITSVSMCVLNDNLLWQFAKEQPGVAVHLSDLARQEEAVLYEHLTNVGRRSSLWATAHLLLELYCRMDLRGAVENGVCRFPLSQQHVGDSIGSTAVHVSRMMKHIRASGLINAKGGHLVVPDFERAADHFEFSPNYIFPKPIF